MSFINESLSIFKLIKNFKPTQENTLPENTYFLNENYILCKDRKYGDSRYPYTNDGLTLWAHSSGNIQINESSFFFFNPTLEGKQSALTFFGGVKNESGKYDFISINGNADNINFCDVEKYVIYSTTAAYYFRLFKDVLFVLKTGIDDNKNILFSSAAINLSKENKDVYITSYFNPLLTHGSVDSEESKWFKKCELTPFGARFLTIEDLSRSVHLFNYAILKRSYSTDVGLNSTTSREIFATGRNNHISLSKALVNGCFEVDKEITLFNDTAILSDIALANLKSNQSFELNYMMCPSFNEKDVLDIEKQEYLLSTNELCFERLNKGEDKTNLLKFNFGTINGYKVNNVLLNKFLSSVIKQVDYCSKAKNSSLSLLGVRDVFQMLEASLIWDKEFARKKIIDALNYLETSGRSPRQYASAKGNENPLMDNREFIDQGQWIITTIHTYLSFTNDFSILDEECGFVKLIGRNSAAILNEKSTVLGHLLKICEYLLSHVDEDNNCLHTLYGDWNDAVDGLGVTKDETKTFGNGVSAMASMHLYKNLHEMKEIIDFIKIKDPFNLPKRIQEIEEGINSHLILSNGQDKKIIHGFGENKEFYVGSFNDVDGISRDSLTSNAFYAISGLIKNSPNMKEFILNAYKRLDSKYGYLTFSHYFDRSNAEKVGRIVNLPKGTAENAATYIHSTIFGIRSLLLLNESDEAFKQIFKVLPITHTHLTHSPFVMPNSYVYNPEIGVDGESMNDWYTGSSNTLIKALVFDLFGIRPLIGDKISLTPANKFPSDNASIELSIKNKLFEIIYKNTHKGTRTIFLNGEAITSFFSIDLCKDENKIEIID